MRDLEFDGGCRDEGQHHEAYEDIHQHVVVTQDEVYATETEGLPAGTHNASTNQGAANQVKSKLSLDCFDVYKLGMMERQ